MEKYAWKATLKDGMKEEYIRRHNEIWPALVELLKSAGIENYSIWLCGHELFGYYECKHCKHRYVPTYKAVNMAMHMGRTRYMRCPQCGKKSWQKKVLSKD